MPKKKKGHDRVSSSDKRTERSVRKALRQERRRRERISDKDFVRFNSQLLALGLKLKDVPGDGNCLFHSLADQLDGGVTRHRDIRRDVVHFMRDNRLDFEPFLDEDEPFEDYMSDLAKNGTYAGNDVIVAFGRCFGLDVVIHQLNAPSLEVLCPLGSYTQKSAVASPGRPQRRALRVAYLDGEHYCSVLPSGASGGGKGAAVPTATRAHEGKTRTGSKGSTAEAGNNTKTESNQTKGDGLKVIGRDPIMSTSLTEGEGVTGTSSAGNDLQAESPPISVTQTVSEPSSSIGVPSREVCPETDDPQLWELLLLTGCQDLQLAQECLLDAGYDVSTAVSILLHLMEVVGEDPIPEERTSHDSHVTSNISHGHVPSSGDQSLLSSQPHPQMKPPKVVKQPSTSQHLSNKKRKEQAKQERKQRRLEEKRNQKSQEVSVVTDDHDIAVAMGSVTI